MGMFRFLTLILMVTLVISCSTSPKRVELPSKSSHVSQPSSEPIEHNENYLKKAEEIFAQTGSVEQRNELLLKAADALYQENQFEKSIKLLQVLRPELSEERQSNIANLLITESLLSLASVAANAQAHAMLSKLVPIAGYEQRYYRLQATILSQQRQWVLASEYLLKTSMPEDEKSQQIWQWLQHLDTTELKKAQSKPNKLQPWLQLSIILRSYGLDPVEFAEQVSLWQQRNSEHPLAKSLPSEVDASLQIKTIQARKIAVLLPLTGRLASQGLVLKEGILAAYLQNLSTANLPPETLNSAPQLSELQGISGQEFQQLRFFDSNLKSPEELNALVADFDFIIGPLLKENISGLVDVLPSDKIMLALNRNENTSVLNRAINLTSGAPQPTKEHYFFALAPEDEAQQLAQYIKRKGFKHPIIFTADNSVTSRMTDAFVETWLAGDIPMKQPSVAIFSDSKDMREQVEGLLDVAQSKNRIRQMENVANVEVFGEERNRQDVDVIILFASPEQTELLNPIIEASLTPSAGHSLAVFASSRSYSLELSKNSLRDLRNLTFSDMPWMLPNHSWPELSNEINELWPQRQDALLRLFAMGFDAYELIKDLRYLKQLPQVTKSGLTGKLNIDDKGVLHRQLPLAKVIQDRVSLLAVD